MDWLSGTKLGFFKILDFAATSWLRSRSFFKGTMSRRNYACFMVVSAELLVFSAFLNTMVDVPLSLSVSSPNVDSSL